MFSRLTDLGKNLTDELSRINDEVKSSRTMPKKQVTQDEAARIMKLKTPNVSSIVKPEDVASAELDKQGQTKNIGKVSGTSIHTEEHDDKTAKTKTKTQVQDKSEKSGKKLKEEEGKNEGTTEENKESVPVTSEVDLPESVVRKLKKFEKYERLYPRLYEAYKVDKAKLSIVNAFEKALRENTPCDGIGEVSSFIDYLSSLDSKGKVLQKALSEEAKKSADSSREKKIYAKKLEIVSAKNINLQKEAKGFKSKMEKLSAENQRLSSTFEENAELQKTITSLKEKVENVSSKRSPSESYVDRAQETDIPELEKSASDSASVLRSENQYLKNTLEGCNKKINILEAALKKVGERKNATSEEDTLEKGSSLEEELELNKTELEMLRVQNAEALKDYERTKKSLSKKLETSLTENKKVENDLHNVRSKYQSIMDANEKFKNENKKLESENSLLLERINTTQKKADKLLKDNEELHQHLNDLQDKSGTLEEAEVKRKDLAAKLEIAAKETESKNRQISDLEKVDKERQQKIAKLSLQHSSLQKEQKLLVNSKNKLLSDLEQSKQQRTEMKLKFSKVITDNNKLVKEKEELKDKYDNLKEINTGGQAKIENLKRRLDEVLVDKKEFEDRIDTLEERLSQTRTLLQERTRDASTMRKLLKQGDQNRDNKYILLDEQLTDLKEQKEKVDDAHMLLQRDFSQLKDKTTKQINGLQSQNTELVRENTRLKKSMKLHKSISNSEMRKSYSSGQVSLTNDSSDKIDMLQKALTEKSAEMEKLEDMNRILQRANNESNQKLIALNRKLRSMSQQFRRRSSAASMNSSSSMNRSNDTTTQSVTADNEITGENTKNDDNERAIYIRNVLFGFLENKDQRNMLLPVMKTLLVMSDDDEQKFVKLLSKA